jgi:UDP-N-acetylmuramate dehydrogenase
LSELRLCLEWAAAEQLPIVFLGLGSNVLISDRGLPGLVVNLRQWRGLEFTDDGQVWAAAGTPTIKLAHAVAERGWSGLEWAIGIPGTVGGAVFMNAGAHAASTAQVLTSVDILDEFWRPRTLTPDQLQFEYRTSILQQRRWLVVGARFQLEPGHDAARVIAQTQANWEQRHSTQPYDWPSCGSVFRNPSPKTAGWLIEQTGLKGCSLGGAQVAEKHANFILNRDRATAADIYCTIAHVQTQVERQWSLRLHPEVRILGDFSPFEPLL